MSDSTSQLEYFQENVCRTIENIVPFFNNGLLQLPAAIDRQFPLAQTSVDVIPHVVVVFIDWMEGLR